MNEIDNLNEAKACFSKALNAKENSQQFKVEINNFILVTTQLLNELTEEAFQTPAGKRWFSGQLKNHSTIEYFYKELILKGNINLLKVKDDGAFKNRCIKFLDELLLIIKSGIGRYITG